MKNKKKFRLESDDEKVRFYTGFATLAALINSVTGVALVKLELNPAKEAWSIGLILLVLMRLCLGLFK